MNSLLKTKRQFSQHQAKEIENENLKLKNEFKRNTIKNKIKLNENKQIIISNHVYFWDGVLQVLSDDEFNPFIL
jgi:hypothetical protein